MNTACGTESTSSRSAVEIMAVSLLAALLGFRDTVSAAIKNMTLDELKRAALVRDSRPFGGAGGVNQAHREQYCAERCHLLHDCENSARALEDAWAPWAEPPRNSGRGGRWFTTMVQYPSTSTMGEHFTA